MHVSYAHAHRDVLWVYVCTNMVSCTHVHTNTNVHMHMCIRIYTCTCVCVSYSTRLCTYTYMCKQVSHRWRVGVVIRVVVPHHTLHIHIRLCRHTNNVSCTSHTVSHTKRTPCTHCHTPCVFVCLCTMYPHYHHINRRTHLILIPCLRIHF